MNLHGTCVHVHTCAFQINRIKAKQGGSEALWARILGPWLTTAVVPCLTHWFCLHWARCALLQTRAAQTVRKGLLCQDFQAALGRKPQDPSITTVWPHSAHSIPPSWPLIGYKDSLVPWLLYPKMVGRENLEVGLWAHSKCTCGWPCWQSCPAHAGPPQVGRAVSCEVS